MINAIYLPTVDKNGDPVNAHVLASETEKIKLLLALEFGGYTVHDGVGGYVMPSGLILEEEVSVIMSYGRANRTVVNRIRIACSTLANNLNQNSVMYVVNGIPKLYEVK